MKTAELTGALLDYWTARAEGVPAAELEIREVPRTDWKICVRLRAAPAHSKALRESVARAYSTNWGLTGPLIEKYYVAFWHFPAIQGKPIIWLSSAGAEVVGKAEGPTPLIAICRAVVRAAFGDEVEDLPCA